MNPYVFDNTYYKEVLMGDRSKYFKSEMDGELVRNSELKHWVEAYAQDQEMWFDHYAKAHVKVSELGQEEHLMCEFDEVTQVGKNDIMGRVML